MDRIEQINQLLAATPNDSFLQHALALEYIKLGDDNKARALFEQLLAYNPAYVGSYYHLAKLLERLEQRAEAIRIYEQGMAAAQAAGERHALSELRSAYEELTF